MTAYVDDLYRYPLGRVGRMRMSHLVADTEEELHQLAMRLGVARHWFQQKRSAAHYDIAMSKRLLAIKFGAVPISVRVCAMMCFNRRHTGTLGDPATAAEVWKRLRNDARFGFVE